MNLTTTLFLAMSVVALAAPVHAADTKDMMEDRAEARYDQNKDMAKQNYEIAKENCKNLSGNAKDACLKNAKAEYVKATSQAKTKKATGEAEAEAVDDQMKAEYKAAKEKCDELAGDAKDACIADAKRKYRQ